MTTDPSTTATKLAEADRAMKACNLALRDLARERRGEPRIARHAPPCLDPSSAPVNFAYVLMDSDFYPGDSSGDLTDSWQTGTPHFVRKVIAPQPPPFDDSTTPTAKIQIPQIEHLDKYPSSVSYSTVFANNAATDFDKQPAIGFGAAIAGDGAAEISALLAGSRANGTVTLSRTGTDRPDIKIPAGTTLATGVVTARDALISNDGSVAVPVTLAGAFDIGSVVTITSPPSGLASAAPVTSIVRVGANFKLPLGDPSIAGLLYQPWNDVAGLRSAGLFQFQLIIG